MRALRATLAAVLVVLVALPGCYESHTVPFDAPFRASTVTRPCPSTGMAGLGRDCGWRLDSTRICVPGAAIAVACNASCGMGSCSGDAMIRLCAGSGDCTSATSIGGDDDSCGTLCPSTTATCPASGLYTILVASFSDGSASTCSIATRP